ncbi:hypothetical protein B5X24_HaOG206987 [Helicoverpa armigera]|nr:hypothetical protein B5X24_HaOG206987 [Helicoverpa armigera]
MSLSQFCNRKCFCKNDEITYNIFFDTCIVYSSPHHKDTPLSKTTRDDVTELVRLSILNLGEFYALEAPSPCLVFCQMNKSAPPLLILLFKYGRVKFSMVDICPILASVRNDMIEDLSLLGALPRLIVNLQSCFHRD